MRKIKNIIFDLGGVIINLNIPKTIQSFENMGFPNFKQIYTQAQQSSLFDSFDKGIISENEFFTQLRSLLHTEISNNDLKKAWNTMLLDFPIQRLNLLKELKQKYRLFLLSNTNETHVEEFEQALFEQHGYKNLEPFFEKVYYSCRIGMRKPDKEIFDFVLKENNLIPEETVFIDDSIQHVNGAKTTGINVYLLDKNKEVGALLKGLRL